MWYSTSSSSLLSRVNMHPTSAVKPTAAITLKAMMSAMETVVLQASRMQYSTESLPPSSRRPGPAELCEMMLRMVMASGCSPTPRLPASACCNPCTTPAFLAGSWKRRTSWAAASEPMLSTKELLSKSPLGGSKPSTGRPSLDDAMSQNAAAVALSPSLPIADWITAGGGFSYGAQHRSRSHLQSADEQRARLWFACSLNPSPQATEEQVTCGTQHVSWSAVVQAKPAQDGKRVVVVVVVTHRWPPRHLL
mmetsp:Transcript_4722/g.9820  ORF Transcript_4722/g.9820 Transcript_4722/m.9820 type:complete len:250 (-) Transcript_4722:374-1123(-)